MVERKTWEQMSKGERIGGMIGLGVITLVAVVLISSVVHAFTAGNGNPQPVQSATPVTTYKDVKETEAIPFEKDKRDDASRDRGEKVVTTTGMDGILTKTFHVTYVDGKETARVQTKSEVTTAPVTEVTSVGTHIPYVPPATPAPPAQSGCDQNYSGACVPVASDVDCGGGSGNGPEYVYGTVQVVGSDIYDLDRNGDGVGCE